jgi:hypothetical protein
MPTCRPNDGRGDGSIPKLNTARVTTACWNQSRHRYLENPPTLVRRFRQSRAIEPPSFNTTDGYASCVTELASASVNTASVNCGRQHKLTGSQLRFEDRPQQYAKLPSSAGHGDESMRVPLSTLPSAAKLLSARLHCDETVTTYTLQKRRLIQLYPRSYLRTG